MPTSTKLLENEDESEQIQTDGVNLHEWRDKVKKNRAFMVDSSDEDIDLNQLMKKRKVKKYKLKDVQVLTHLNQSNVTATIGATIVTNQKKLFRKVLDKSILDHLFFPEFITELPYKELRKL
eukprot:CAMPEP_0116879856 /NCGR_PEP_ID=MMETSP0463-20121206/11706_1 /TAXON_ID=181622 /ORGANISM="Strombidinopsis sp, Strain SopsisLIS2011" /LENGTH=121 /DNA_ID=CAMNT_0004529695 /DNA_START=636 /DNA_END=1001 /DNA_ORIENTATION=-